MSEELKPCPFCKGEDFSTNKEGNMLCKGCLTSVSIETWNTRPREQELEARVKELEVRLDTSIGSCESLSKEWRREQKENTSLKAELKMTNKAWDKYIDDSMKRAEELEELKKANEWQPIDTAPRDTENGKYLLGINMNGKEKHIPMLIHNTFVPCDDFRTASPGACWGEKGRDWPAYPTHWKEIPLPTPEEDSE